MRIKSETILAKLFQPKGLFIVDFFNCASVKIWNNEIENTQFRRIFVFSSFFPAGRVQRTFDKLHSSLSRKLAIRINSLNRNIFALNRYENKSREKSKPTLIPHGAALTSNFGDAHGRLAQTYNNNYHYYDVVEQRKVCLAASEDLTFAKQSSRLKLANSDDDDDDDGRLSRNELS